MEPTTYAFTHGLDYASIVAASEQVAWTVDAVFHNRYFDASNPIVPASWVRTQALEFLTDQDQRPLNHCRAFNRGEGRRDSSHGGVVRAGQPSG